MNEALHDPTVWDFTIKVFQTVLLPLIGYITWVLRDIRAQLSVLNGRLIKLETWKEEHKKQDDDRHEDLSRRVDRSHPPWRAR